MANENIKLDGREFTGITQSLTANQDDYLLGHLRQAGALEVLGDIDEKRTPKKRYEDLLTRILLSGRKHYILAGFLTEVGKKWSRVDADRNAAAFAEITDQAEKQAMQTTIVGFVLIFFQQEDRLSKSSRKSSSQPNEGQGTSNGDLATAANSRG
jgi:hypothetical protein